GEVYMNSHSKKLWCFFLALAVLFVLSSIAVQAGAPVRNHRTGRGYDSIRAAIADSRPNDIIIVSPGRYEESLIIRYFLTLLAASFKGEMPVIAPGAELSAITVLNPPRGSEVTIDGMAMEVDLTDATNAILMDVAYFTLRNCRVSSRGTGVGLLTFLPS